VPVPITVVPVFTVIKEPISAVPVTLIDLSVTSLIVGIVGAVTSFTVISFTSLVFHNIRSS
jgi:hypothetical protein